MQPLLHETQRGEQHGGGAERKAQQHPPHDERTMLPDCTVHEESGQPDARHQLQAEAGAKAREQEQLGGMLRRWIALVADVTMTSLSL